MRGMVGGLYGGNRVVCGVRGIEGEGCIMGIGFSGGGLCVKDVVWGRECWLRGWRVTCNKMVGLRGAGRT